MMVIPEASGIALDLNSVQFFEAGKLLVILGGTGLLSIIAIDGLKTFYLLRLKKGVPKQRKD
jgi:hypothetical protein